MDVTSWKSPFDLMEKWFNPKNVKNALEPLLNHRAQFGYLCSFDVPGWFWRGTVVAAMSTGSATNTAVWKRCYSERGWTANQPRQHRESVTDWWRTANRDGLSSTNSYRAAPNLPVLFPFWCRRPRLVGTGPQHNLNSTVHSMLI